MFSVLSKDPLGQIVLANIKQAFDHNFIERNCFIEFLKEWKASYDSFPSPLLFTKEIVNIIPSDKKYRFRHVATPILPLEVSTIIQWDYLIHLLDPNFLSSNGISDGDQFEEHFFERLSSALANSDDVFLPGIFGNPRNFEQFWITDSHRIKTFRNSSTTNLADKVRDALGLVHINTNKVLIELRFPSSLISSGNFATPTFIEAGDHRRFKAHGNPTINNGWGLTVHLQNAPYGSGVINGEPELTAKSVPISNGTNWHMEGIGRTITYAEGIDSGNGAAILSKDREFADILWNSYDINDFVNNLNAIV